MGDIRGDLYGFIWNFWGFSGFFSAFDGEIIMEI